MLFTILGHITLLFSVNCNRLLVTEAIRSTILEDTAVEKRRKRQRQDEALPYMRNKCHFFGGPRKPL
jgi:hypothetical protein